MDHESDQTSEVPMTTTSITRTMPGARTTTFWSRTTTGPIPVRVYITTTSQLPDPAQATYSDPWMTATGDELASLNAAKKQATMESMAVAVAAILAGDMPVTISDTTQDASSEAVSTDYATRGSSMSTPMEIEDPSSFPLSTVVETAIAGSTAEQGSEALATSTLPEDDMSCCDTATDAVISTVYTTPTLSTERGTTSPSKISEVATSGASAEGGITTDTSATSALSPSLVKVTETTYVNEPPDQATEAAVSTAEKDDGSSSPVPIAGTQSTETPSSTTQSEAATSDTDLTSDIPTVVTVTALPRTNTFSTTQQIESAAASISNKNSENSIVIVTAVSSPSKDTSLLDVASSIVPQPSSSSLGESGANVAASFAASSATQSSSDQFCETCTAATATISLIVYTDEPTSASALDKERRDLLGSELHEWVIVREEDAGHLDAKDHFHAQIPITNFATRFQPLNFPLTRWLAAAVIVALFLFPLVHRFRILSRFGGQKARATSKSRRESDLPTWTTKPPRPGTKKTAGTSTGQEVTPTGLLLVSGQDKSERGRSDESPHHRHANSREMSPV